MWLNQGIAISTSNVLLVPYEACHVISYHEWAQHGELQCCMALDDMSLQDQYDLQEVWRPAHDQLTFIICVPVDSDNKSELKVVEGGNHDARERRVGYVHLFLSQGDEDEDGAALDVVGELDLKIEPRSRDVGRAAITAFLHYIELHIEEIFYKFKRGENLYAPITLLQFDADYRRRYVHQHLLLKVQANEDDVRNLMLFQSLGFEYVSKQPDFWGNFELVLAKNTSLDWTTRNLADAGVKDWREVPYVLEEDVGNVAEYFED